MRLTSSLPRRKSPISAVIPPWLSMGLLATMLIGLLFVIQSRVGLDLADEGFLWYGTWRTYLGEVPLRDFQGYDPGRYVWGAFWFQLWGNDGLLALRASNALFQLLGLTCGLLTMRRLTRSPWLLLGSGVILLLWMYPRHKLFESSIALAAVYVAVLLVETPSLRRHFAAGVFVGVAGFMGRQHGFYTAVSFFLLIGFIWLKLDRSQWLKRYGLWGLGVFIGYSPMVWMLATIAGFWDAFIESVLFLIRLNNTNLPLPIPTVWSIPFDQLGGWTVSHAVSIALGFALLPMFTGASLVYLLWQTPAKLRQQTVLVGATFLSLTYIHYAFSRADVPHLAQGIDPMLVGLLAVMTYMVRAGLRIWGGIMALGLTLMTVLGIGYPMPIVTQWRSPTTPYVEMAIGRDRLWVYPTIANFIQNIETIHDQRVKPDESILLAPHIPMLYPILERRSPIWDLYLLFPETPAREQEIISELQQTQTNWVILGDIALDGRDELRFKNTHPLTWQSFSDTFEAVPTDRLPENYQFLHRKPG